ncbi:hypothetical protein D3C76_1305880 [compost metagenome]
MPGHRLGVVDQALQLLIHFLGDPGVQHADLEREGARYSLRHRVEPLDNLDQIAQGFDHPAQGADGALVGMDVIRRLDGRALGRLAPPVIPAIDRPGPRQVRQQMHRAGVGVVERAQWDNRLFVERRFQGALQLRAIARQ